ncbi:arrestin domain-containing protein 2-like [Apostichopus japonicus]|uniref:arrestin domain-containing protein 2-like n=1 Tax=Stichopus japonicus TaxID=307972 RepID=UPI003AB346DB
MVNSIMGGSSSLCEVKIFLDQTFYTPGSIARGHVEVLLTQETHIGDVVAEVIGESVIYSNYRTLCKFEQTIFRSPDVSQAGNHRFPFVFEIPTQSTPSTYHARDGDVTYVIKAKTLAGKCKKEFTVISHLDELTEEIDESSFQSSFVKQGPYSVEVLLQRTGYLPGERIGVLLNLSRGKQSPLSISPFITTELFAAVRCQEQKGFLTSKVCLERKRFIFPRTARHRMRQVLQIPADAMPATSFKTAFEHPVELNYYLNVRLSSKEIQIPIKVGKKRIRERNFENARLETWTTV